MRSRSLRFAVASIYPSTSVFCSVFVIFDTNSCSGANVIKLTPKMVSGRVVKTSITSSCPFTLKDTDAPTDFPIQLRCVSLRESVQSIVSKPCSKRSAYAEIRIDHCVIFFLTTGCPPRSDTPFTISSFAKTVPKAGHQFTSVLAKYVNLYFNNISCCFSDEYPFHASAEKASTSSSHTAFTFSFPARSNSLINSEIDSALLSVLQ